MRKTEKCAYIQYRSLMKRGEGTHKVGRLKPLTQMTRLSVLMHIYHQGILSGQQRVLGVVSVVGGIVVVIGGKNLNKEDAQDICRGVSPVAASNFLLKSSVEPINFLRMPPNKLNWSSISYVERVIFLFAKSRKHEIANHEVAQWTSKTMCRSTYPQSGTIFQTAHGALKRVDLWRTLLETPPSP